MMLLTDEERKLANGNIPWKKIYPNGSEEIYFTGHIIFVKAPGPTGKFWSKNFKIQFVVNRQYGDHTNAIKRNGKWYYISIANDGLFWK